MTRTSLALVATLALAACATSRSPESMTAIVAMDSLATGAEDPTSSSSVIAARDVLRVTVFQVPDLSVPEVRVDGAGLIELPLIGSVRAAGRTPTQLAEDIRVRLAARYLQNPQVTVSVDTPSVPKVTIDGAVGQPGVFEMQGRTTLMQAIAMARGTTNISNSRSVAVFRTIDGQRSAAIFDLTAIRRGQAEDPVLMNDDVVVVDVSRLNSALRDAIGILPAFAVFRSY